MFDESLWLNASVRRASLVISSHEYTAGFDKEERRTRPVTERKRELGWDGMEEQI